MSNDYPSEFEVKAGEMFTQKLCCSGLGKPGIGNCGRGTRKGCNGSHCKCMEKDCTNMHYVDCFEHYIHVEHIPKNE